MHYPQLPPTARRRLRISSYLLPVPFAALLLLVALGLYRAANHASSRTFHRLAGTPPGAY